MKMLCIETDFSQLSAQFNIERVLAKKFQGLCVRLLTKFLAFNICIFNTSKFENQIFNFLIYPHNRLERVGKVNIYRE